MPRLIDYIRSNGFYAFTEIAQKAGAEQCDRLNRSIPVVVVDQAAEFFAFNAGSTLCPPVWSLVCVLPPYDDCWVEYRITEEFRKHMCGDSLSAMKEIGARITSGTNNNAPAWAKELSDSAHEFNPDWQPYGWAELHVFMRHVAGQPHAGLIYFKHRQVFDRLGQIGRACKTDYLGQKRDSQASRDSLIYPILLGLSFMNFKKDVRVEERVPPGPGKVGKKKSQPLVRYKVLDIQAFGERLLSYGGSEEPGKLKRALHAVRQHIRVYGPDRPHVSGYVGAMLVRPHLRGSKSEGEIVKDYQLQTSAVS